MAAKEKNKTIKRLNCIILNQYIQKSNYRNITKISNRQFNRNKRMKDKTIKNDLNLLNWCRL